MVINPIDQEDGFESDMTSDRRRPGRQNDVNPALIPLLRGDVDNEGPSLGENEDPDPIAALRGIVLATPIAIILWILVGIAIWALRRGL
jgi:hypothetical protein